MKARGIIPLLLLALMLVRPHVADSSDSYDDFDKSYSDEDDDDSADAGPAAPAIEEPIEESHDDPNHPHISFATGSEEEHLHNFKRISDDLKLYEDEYIACIDAIHDEDYSEETIQGCLGKDFIKLQLDIKYETMKVISRAEDKLRHFFIYHCYAEAGEDEIQALACDLLQKDMLDALWNCMDFIELADMNRAKYTEEYANLPMAIFKSILVNLEALHKEFFELIEEIDAHKQVTLLRIKTHIDDRTQIIVKQASHDQRKLTAPTVVTHTIKIQEKVKDPNFRLINTLPNVSALADGSPDPNYFLYAKNVKSTALDRRGEKSNALRMLNLGNGYDGLHSANREGERKLRNGAMSFKQNFRSTLDKFKNTHMSYPSAAHKRFK